MMCEEKEVNVERTWNGVHALCPSLLRNYEFIIRQWPDATSFECDVLPSNAHDC